MPKAKVFMSGNSQAVRLPREFRVSVDELEIERRGDEIVLRERPKTLGRLARALDDLSDCGLASPDDPQPQERDGL